MRQVSEGFTAASAEADKDGRGNDTLQEVRRSRKPRAGARRRGLASVTRSVAPMRGAIVALLALTGPVSPAAAQSRVRCSAFLHERDGAWRAFEPGVIFGPRGPISVHTGERFRRGRPSGSDYVAGVLDTLCRTD